MTTSPALIDLDELPPSAGGLRVVKRADYPDDRAYRAAVDAAQGIAFPAAPRDNRQVLHGIRALLAFIAFALVSILMLLLAQAAGLARGGVSTVEAPVMLQLLQPGPDPAIDYYAHAVFADGTERDLQLGGYVLHTGLVSVELGVTAEQGSESGCRIVIDGVRVAEGGAVDGNSTVCKWTAP